MTALPSRSVAAGSFCPSTVRITSPVGTASADEVTSIRHFLTVDRRVNRVIAIDDRAVKTLESFDFVPAGQVGRVKIWVRRESGGTQDRDRESNAPSRTATEAG